TDGDGRADEQIVLFTGFGESNHEQLLNSFQWGLDNWVHGCGGGNGGDIRPADQPDAKPISVRGRDFRFRLRPERLKALTPSPADAPPAPATRPARFAGCDFGFETTSGGGQYGLTTDAADRCLTCSNARHIKQIVLPEHYLKRNPHLSAPGVLIDISD